MKMFLPVLAVILSMSSFSNSNSGYIISSRAYIYSEASFSSKKITYDSQEVILSHGQEISILEEQGDFLYINITIKQNVLSGYVYKYYVTSSAPQTVYPVFNGSVRRETVLYDIDFMPTEYKLKAGQEVYIYKGYDRKQFTAVQVVLDDGTLYHGYINTQDLEPQGISPLLIVGISIIAACVTVILSLIFIKKVKKKK